MADPDYLQARRERLEAAVAELCWDEGDAIVEFLEQEEAKTVAVLEALGDFLEYPNVGHRDKLVAAFDALVGVSDE